MPETEKKTSEETQAMADTSPGSSRTEEKVKETEGDTAQTEGLAAETPFGTDDVVAGEDSLRGAEAAPEDDAAEQSVSEQSASTTDAAPVTQGSPDSDAVPVLRVEEEADEKTEVADAPPADIDPVEKPTERPAARPVEAPAEPAQSGGGSFFAMLLGGVVAAAIGAGAMYYMGPQLSNPSPDDVDGSMAELAARLDDLTAELAAVKGAPGSDLSGVQSGVDQAISSAAGLSSALEGLEARLAALESGGASGGGEQLAALSAEVQALRQMIEDGGAQALQDRINEAAAQAQAALDDANAEAERLRAEALDEAQAARVQSAVARLRAAIDNGAPTDGPVADLQAAGREVPSVLTGPVPSIEALQDGFAEPAREALGAARRQAAENGSTGEKIRTFLLTQTGARSLDAQEGDSPNAVLSRAQTAVDAADFETAQAEISGLPEAGQAAMADWVAATQTRIDALGALDQLGADVN